MTAYFLGLATPLAVIGVLWLVLASLTITNTISLSCECGADWGNPMDRGWRRWWQWLRMRAHDHTAQHQRWRRERGYR